MLSKGAARPAASPFPPPPPPAPAEPATTTPSICAPRRLPPSICIAAIFSLGVKGRRSLRQGRLSRLLYLSRRKADPWERLGRAHVSLSKKKKKRFRLFSVDHCPRATQRIRPELFFPRAPGALGSSRRGRRRGEQRECAKGNDAKRSTRRAKRKEEIRKKVKDEFWNEKIEKQPFAALSLRALSTLTLSTLTLSTLTLSIESRADRF